MDFEYLMTKPGGDDFEDVTDVFDEAASRKYSVVLHYTPAPRIDISFLPLKS